MLHDPKKLQETIELDYVQRPSRRRRVKHLVQWLTLATSLALVAWTCLPTNRSVYQADSVSVAHAMFNQDCSTCHDRAFQPLGRLFGSPGNHSVSAQTCTSCHAGPDHHPPQAMATDCVDCHREHRGQPMLAHVFNKRCTKCHSDLKAVKSDTKLEDVGDFFSAHPEFALWRRHLPDAGTVQFNHAKHLNLAPEDFQRPGDFRSLVSRMKQQQCNFCHESDPAGRYMLPIKYENHCKDCHPLLVQVTGKWQNTKILEAASAFANKPVPHPGVGQRSEMVRAALRERYLDFVQRFPQVLGKHIPEDEVRPFPGTGAFPPITENQFYWLNRQMKDAERLLFDGADGCRRCHQEVKAQPVWRPNGLPDYGEPKIPRRWFGASKFSHHSHRGMNCLDCHSQAAASTQTADILMPKIADCRQCHHPQGGARTDCFECHTFHARQGPHKDLPWPSK